jgi:hypothetical protein
MEFFLLPHFSGQMSNSIELCLMAAFFGLFLTLKMMALPSYETSVNFYLITGHHILEDNFLQIILLHLLQRVG